MRLLVVAQHVVGKAASILPVMILLKLPKKRRIRMHKKKRQLINPNMSQPGWWWITHLSKFWWLTKCQTELKRRFWRRIWRSWQSCEGSSLGSQMGKRRSLQRCTHGSGPRPSRCKSAPKAVWRVTLGKQVVRLQWLMTMWKTKGNHLHSCKSEDSNTCFSKPAWWNSHLLILWLWLSLPKMSSPTWN